MSESMKRPEPYEDEYVPREYEIVVALNKAIERWVETAKIQTTYPSGEKWSSQEFIDILHRLTETTKAIDAWYIMAQTVEARRNSSTHLQSPTSTGTGTAMHRIATGLAGEVGREVGAGSAPSTPLATNSAPPPKAEAEDEAWCGLCEMQSASHWFVRRGSRTFVVFGGTAIVTRTSEWRKCLGPARRNES